MNSNANHVKRCACPDCAILRADRIEVLELQFEEARKIIAEVSYSPEFKKWHYNGKEQDPCGVHAFTAKYAAGTASQAGLPLESRVPVAEKRVEGGHKCVRCRMRDVPAVGLTCESCYG